MILRRKRSSWTTRAWRSFIDEFAPAADRVAWFITYRQIQQIPVIEPVPIVSLDPYRVVRP